MQEIRNVGDAAFLVRWDSEVDAVAWARALRSQRWPGVVDINAAYHTVGITCDPDKIDLESLPDRLFASRDLRRQADAGRELFIPVLYDGVDLESSAQSLGLSVEALITAHTSQSYDVFAVGFLPGFPYAGYLPELIAGLARLSSPRVRVPTGSVAIVGKQTAVYPSESPGGWRLIGRTPLCLVDLADGYFPIEAGDRLRFQSIDAEAFAQRLGERP